MRLWLPEVVGKGVVTNSLPSPFMDLLVDITYQGNWGMSLEGV